MNNGKKFSFLKTDKTNKEFFNTLKKALKEGTGNNKATKSLALAESIVKNGKQYIKLKGKDSLQIKFSDISKSNVSGISSKVSGAETAARLEGGVYLRLCEYLGQKPLVSSDSKIKKDLEVAVTGLTEKETFEICDKQAKNIINKLKLKGKKPLLVACDVYRPAAIKQLQINGEKQEVDVFSMGDTHKPSDIAKAAIAHAEKNGHNVVILDTAGRLHIDEDLVTNRG